MSRRILVTGGAGFIGLHLVRRLLEGDDEITIADDFSRGRMDADLEAVADCVRLVTLDVTEPLAFEALEGPYDEIYHLAAVLGVSRVLAQPLRVLDVNLTGTLNLLRRLDALGGGRLLLASTSEVYAWTRRFHELPVPTPEDVPLAVTDVRDPRASYAVSKIAAELAVAQWAAAHGREHVALRYHNVYGPRMGFDHVIPELYQRAQAGEDPLVVYSPLHRRAFCYVSDAVDCTIAAMRSARAAGETINVGDDREECAIEDLTRRLLAIAGLERELVGRQAENDPIDRRCPDISRARALLAYEPRVGLDEGLERTLAWYAAAVAPSGAA
jgi:UDP-glucose 4-epimerase/UDP-glucuronate decarboxylase